MFGLHLGHLATGEIKNLLAEQFQDDHVVLTEALAGPTCSHNIADERGPVFGPFLLQDLKQFREVELHLSPSCNCARLSHSLKYQMCIYLYEDHVEF